MNFIFTAALDFFFPIFCVVCGKEKTHCCKECIGKAVNAIDAGSGISDYAPTDSIHSISRFKNSPPLIELIHRLKYDGAKDTVPILGSIINNFFVNGNCDFLKNNREIILVPVPLHPRRLRFRGFNQSLFIAEEIKKILNKTERKAEIVELLRRHKYTRPQVELFQKERISNVKEAFSLSVHRQTLNPEALHILVDDISTTGSTINECRAELKKHGAKKIIGFVIART